MSERDLRAVAREFEAKLKKIKLTIFDVDGVLTDGRLFYQGEEMGFNRFFHVRDGYGIKILQRSGIEVAIISGGDSLGVKKRLDNLKIKHQYLGFEDKRAAYLDVLKKTNLTDEEVVYIGDEFFDIPLLKKCGFSATVPHASYEVKEVCDYVCQTPAGQGVAREVIELIRYAQNIVPQIADFE